MILKDIKKEVAVCGFLLTFIFLRDCGCLAGENKVCVDGLKYFKQTKTPAFNRNDNMIQRCEE